MKRSWTTVGLVFLYHFHTFLSLISTWQILSIPGRTLQHKYLLCGNNVGVFTFSFPKVNFYSAYKVKLTM